MLSVPADRNGLKGWHLRLQPAVRAGVTRDDVKAGRLVRGECFEPDPKAYGGRVFFTVTTLMPPASSLTCARSAGPPAASASPAAAPLLRPPVEDG